MSRAPAGSNPAGRSETASNVPRANVRNKSKRVHGSRGLSEPAYERAAVVGQGCSEQAAVLRSMPPVHGGFGDEEGDRHRPDVPAESSGDHWRETFLRVQLREELAEVDQLSLDLDNQHRPRDRMPAEQVDDSTLAELRVRDFGLHLPAPEPRDPADEELGERGVPRVDDPIKVECTRPWLQGHSDLEDLGDRSQVAEAEPTRMPVLQARDLGTRQPRPVGELLLRHGTSNAREPDHATERQVIHGRTSLTGAASRLLIRTHVRYDGRRPARGGQPGGPAWRTGAETVNERAAKVDEARLSGDRAWTPKGGNPQHVGIGRRYKPQDVVVLP